MFNRAFYSLATVLLLGLWVVVTPAQNKPQPGCGADIPVNAMFRSWTGNNTGDKLYGDRALYVNGTTGVSTVLQVNNCTFDFIINLSGTAVIYANMLDSNKLAAGEPGIASPNSVLTTTFFNFDRVAHIPVTPTTAVGVDYDHDSDFGRFCDSANADTRYNVVYGGCWQDLSTGQWYVKRAATSNLRIGRNSDNPLRLQKPPDGTLLTAAQINNPYQTSFVRVTRPDTNTWVLTPEPALGTDPLATLFTKSNKQYYRVGQYGMQFQLTLTRQ